MNVNLDFFVTNEILDRIETDFGRLKEIVYPYLDRLNIRFLDLNLAGRSLGDA